MSNKKRKVDSECRVFNKEWTEKYFFYSVVIGNPEQHVHKALHTKLCNNRDHLTRSLYYCLFVPHTYIFVLRAHPVRDESHKQRNTTGEVATTSPPFYNEPHPSHILCVKAELRTTSTSWSQHHFLRSEIPNGMCTKLRTVAESNNRDHLTRSLYCCLFAPHTYIFVLRAHPVRGESHNQRSTTRKVATIDTGPSKASCLICNETCAVFNEYNINRHFVAKHKDFGQQFLTQELKIKATDMVKKLKQQQRTLIKCSSTQGGCYKDKFCFGTQDCLRREHRCIGHSTVANFYQGN